MLVAQCPLRVLVDRAKHEIPVQSQHHVLCLEYPSEGTNGVCSVRYKGTNKNRDRVSPLPVLIALG